uniref:Si:ch73-15b2.5 n=1 Tax=Neogobius melanostomus TaxID=47308 RepID=A0A8C6WKJ7_9GOBI
MFANTFIFRSSESDEEVQSTRFRSKFVRNLPLYQEYCLQDVRENIKRLQKSSLSELIISQCVQGLEPQVEKLSHSQTCSPQSSPSPAPECFTTPPSTKPKLIKVTPSTLWQDLEEVKGSGLLQNLCSKEIRLHETAFELICSEASYLRSLEIAVKYFYGSKALRQTLTQMEHHILFSNIEQVMTTSEKFLTDLELQLGECFLIGSQVGDVVLRHCPAFHRLYVSYVTNMMYQEALIRQLQQQNKDFQSVLSKLERSPVCQRQNLKSFLVLPFQRITRIKLILETIFRLSKAESYSFTNLEKAIQAVHEVVQECDNGVRKMKQIEELICLEMHLDFDKVKSIPLVISGRFLMHQGPVKQLSLENSTHSRMSFTHIYLHLLSDMLIISSKRDERFEVLDHAEFPTRSRCERFNAEALGLPPNSFLLHLSKRKTGPATVLVLVTDTRLAKESWINALSSKE